NTGGNSSDKIGTITIYNLQKGEYAMGIYNAALPTDSNSRVKCSFNTGIAEVSKGRNFRLYPNPANESAVLSFEINSFSTLQVFDVLGKKLIEQKISPNQTSASLNLKNYA